MTTLDGEPRVHGVPEGGRPSSLAVANTALRNSRLLLIVPLLSMVVAGALALVVGSTYIAEATFKPESGQLPAGGMAGFAAQLGFDLGSMQGGESLEYYARLVESREILTDALRSEYTVGAEGGETRTANLFTLYGIDAPTEDQRVLSGVLRLRKDISVTLDQAANVVSLQTEAPTKDLAVALNARLLELMSRFNLDKRQSQARAEREFVEEQTRRAAAELQAAEARLADFLVQNRRYQGSPELINEVERLKRRVDLRQQVYAGLAQAYEQAKLEEVRNTPVFTVLDRPEGSAREVGGVFQAMVLGLVAGLVLAGFWVFLREYLAVQRRLHPEDYSEFARRTRALRRLWPLSRSSAAADPDPALPPREPESPRVYHAG